MTPPPLHTLSITRLTGVGAALAEKLSRLYIQNVQDLLFHLPYRYQDRTQITPISELKPGDYAVISGTVVDTKIINARTKMFHVFLSDETGLITLKFFHFNLSFQKQFSIGQKLKFFGQVKEFGRELSLIHPEKLNLDSVSNQHMQSSLTPIYPSTEGVNQKTWWRLTEQALQLLKAHQDQLPDLLPEEWTKAFSLPSLTESLILLHRPPPETNVSSLMNGMHPAQQRLACEELLAHHASLRKTRLFFQNQQAAPIPKNKNLLDKFKNSLAFTLTKAQDRVIEEILNDLKKTTPMQRLIQGDVGSGKTVVAVLSALMALAAGYQVAFMAPTELLAEQHFQNFTQWLKPFGFEVLLVISKLNARTKKHNHNLMTSNLPLVAIGTHALFQTHLEFSNLALVIIDEQHRFGVDQRRALCNKGTANNLTPHQLIMTATPIPRTLAMTAYADLDYSVIDELPKGRKPIITRVFSNQKRSNLLNKITEICEKGEQIYWVCPLITESEVLQCQAAESCYQELLQQLPEIKIGLIHGRMLPKEKTAVMDAFKIGALNILVATSVIEVGVDVPNASYMIIENAERLGLAQLHQLRGRVGRGNTQSYCLLLYQAPLSHLSQARLNILRESQDGFIIAQKDLQLRGPGEILGVKQTGLIQLKIADLIRDQIWLERIQNLPVAWWNTKMPEQLIMRWLSHQQVYASV